jgi:hypothetical protein
MALRRLARVRPRRVLTLLVLAAAAACLATFTPVHAQEGEELFLPLLSTPERTPPPGGGGTNLLQNAGFEDSDSDITPWQVGQQTTWQLMDNIKHSGARGINLYSGSGATDLIYQTVTIPANATRIDVAYWYTWLSGEEKPNADLVCADLFDEQDLTQPVWERCIDVAGIGTQDWAQAQYTVTGAELAALKGKTVLAVFGVVTDAEDFTEVWLDDLALIVAR